MRTANNPAAAQESAGRPHSGQRSLQVRGRQKPPGTLFRRFKKQPVNPEWDYLPELGRKPLIG